MLKWATTLGFFALILGMASQAHSQSVADFYRGKTVTILVGYPSGGGYDIYARAIGKRLGDYIPGKPTVITQNMPGAGSLTATNYLYNAAPKDGTVIATFARGMPMLPLLDPGKARFDPSKFVWLGSAADEVSVCGVMAQSKIKSLEDMKTIPFTVSGEGGGSDPDTYAAVMRDLFGAKLKLVTGYPGASEMTLAMQRGEVDGRCGWSYSAIKTTRPEWLKEGTFKMLLNMGMERNSALPDLPSVMELATNDRQRAILALVFSRQVFARPFAMSPGIPADRAVAMKKAFMETLSDPAFLDEANKLGLEVSPVGADVVEKLVADLNATPKDIIEEARKIVSAEP